MLRWSFKLTATYTAILRWSKSLFLHNLHFRATSLELLLVYQNSLRRVSSLVYLIQKSVWFIITKMEVFYTRF